MEVAMSKQMFKKTTGTADRSTAIPGYSAEEGSAGRELKGDVLDVRVQDAQVRSNNDVGRKKRPRE
jgi:hypothetical protein